MIHGFLVPNSGFGTGLVYTMENNKLDDDDDDDDAAGRPRRDMLDGVQHRSGMLLLG